MRSQLNAYGEAILRSREPLGTSCYEVYGRLAGLADAPDVFFDLSDPLTHSDEELRRRVGMVRRLQANSRAFLDGDAHPWGGNRPSNASPRSPSRDPVPTVAPWAAVARAGAANGAELAMFLGVQAPSTPADLHWVVGTAQLARRGYAVPQSWFRAPSLAPYTQAAAEHARTSARYRDRSAAILEHYRPSAMALDTGGTAGQAQPPRPRPIRLATASQSGADRALRERSAIEAALVALSSAARALGKR